MSDKNPGEQVWMISPVLTAIKKAVENAAETEREYVKVSGTACVEGVETWIELSNRLISVKEELLRVYGMFDLLLMVVDVATKSNMEPKVQVPRDKEGQ